jgi:hypothetical protein
VERDSPAAARVLQLAAMSREIVLRDVQFRAMFERLQKAGLDELV